MKNWKEIHVTDLIRQKLKGKWVLILILQSSAKLTKGIKKEKSEYKLTHKTRRLNLHDIPTDVQKYEYFEFWNNIYGLSALHPNFPTKNILEIKCRWPIIKDLIIMVG